MIQTNRPSNIPPNRPSKKIKTLIADTDEHGDEHGEIDVEEIGEIGDVIVQQVPQAQAQQPQAPQITILHRNVAKNTIDIKPFTKLFGRMVLNGEIQPLATPREYAKCLQKHGYIVIPLYDPQVVDAKHQEFKQCLHQMPEYKHPMPKWRGEEYYVKGGFGALGNPSSFHNTFVRQVRKHAMKKVIPIFSEYRRLPGNGGGNGGEQDLGQHKLEQLIDRMRVLRPKADIMAESWHRDTTPSQFASGEDVIFGGWISFDKFNDRPQKLSAFHKSHRVFPIPMRTTQQGFMKASAEEIAELDKLKNAYLSQTNNDGWFIEVPSGHMLIFHQEMIHEVKKAEKGMTEPSLRLFTAWRLTPSNSRFMNAQHPNFFSKMTVPLLKSGQKIAMWPNANWKPNAWGGLSEWSQTTFKRTFLESREMKSIHESKIIIPEYFTPEYGMNAISIKLQAGDLIDAVEGEEEEVSDVLETIRDEPPRSWISRYSRDVLRDEGINPDDNFYPNYTPDEISIMTPNTEWEIDGQHYNL